MDLNQKRLVLLHRQKVYDIGGLFQIYWKEFEEALILLKTFLLGHLVKIVFFFILQRS
jgi:hypothetical protein